MKEYELSREDPLIKDSMGLFMIEYKLEKPSKIIEFVPKNKV